ncbi:glycine betaine ABC transporter substrate-binding protein [Aquibacillus sp. 3ASR75-11]|uniref:Glycine betaine ABC transporter substrate-binding protein n=1 Tax=Terrihalobacillus insolitus TaxID=2950438 RepID=A0A9X3WPB3_9BACI|nr:glycine betaine ABC transporter substrate-binding protein [Terrihalobacillus insolitus]MDC3411884.1 glycine betaine ABC transporter substrate-binding protein [Terrihalobacillus insolitus]MDC3423437.1 glycine betaine ABC transporter substrate-binding protein [Terrihalobacillus insolitus]
MRKFLLFFITIALVTLAACGNGEEENNESNKEGNGKEEKGTIVFGQTPWTSTAPPTQIAKQILEEQGFEVEVQQVSQPIIWDGMRNKDIDFFMDAWLPYTEAPRWEEFKNDLVKVATSYENAKLGWVVPSYVEENSIEELKANAEKYNEEILTIAEGAGIVEVSKDLIEGEKLEDFDLKPSSEGAMISVAQAKIADQEPVVFTAWRPHSIFARNDLKFLEGQEEYFKPDNVYVLSYKGIEEAQPEAYEILSNWSISIDDVEAMILANEENGTSFEELAADWIENNREKVDQMIGK